MGLNETKSQQREHLLISQSFHFSFYIKRPSGCQINHLSNSRPHWPTSSYTPFFNHKMILTSSYKPLTILFVATKLTIYCPKRKKIYLKLTTLKCLPKLPVSRRNIVACHCPTITCGDLKRKALPVEDCIALPVLSPVS